MGNIDVLGINKYHIIAYLMKNTIHMVNCQQ